MKKLLLLASVLFFGIVKSKAQVVVNKLYPGAGNHTFFELYNTNTASTPFH
ncbi:MAG TPA: hypothetical protein VF487_09145 [Chitinophagaceae bacterium]